MRQRELIQNPGIDRPHSKTVGRDTEVFYGDAGAILNPASGFMGDYDFTLNPYSGCYFG